MEKEKDQLSVEGRMTLRRLRRVIEYIRSHDAELPLQTVACFLTVALEEGLSISKIGEKLGLSQSSASRNMSILTDRTWRKTEGLRVAEYRQSYEDITTKPLFLTPKGKRWADTIITLLDAGKEGHDHES